MPLINSNDASLADLKGLHLWHAPMSSCSQRVRIVLAEQGLGYESHPVDLEAGEHATAAYQLIHPKGVVPALVDNGALYIESIDIIQHLARSNSALTSGSQDLLKMAGEAQLDLKLLTFEFLFRGGAPKADEAAREFQANHKNEWLKQFYRDFHDGFDRDRIDQAVRRTAAEFSELDARLADGRPFLCGDTLSLSDIAWMPNAHRFSLMDFPFHLMPHLLAWFDRMRLRPSYQTGLLNWQPEKAQGAFAAYTNARRTEGTDIRAFGGL